MSNEFEEYKFTAYLLGELDETERREVEEILANSPSARRQLDELRETTGLLQEGLQAELLLAPEERLDQARRERVSRAIVAPGRKPSVLAWSFFSATWVRALSVAASLVILASLSYWVVNQGIGPEEKVQTRAAQSPSEQDVPSEPVPAREALDKAESSGSKTSELRQDSQTTAEQARGKAESAGGLERTTRQRASRGSQPVDEAEGRRAFSDTRQERDVQVPTEARELYATAPGVAQPAPRAPSAPPAALGGSLQNQAVNRTGAPASFIGAVKDRTGLGIPGALVKLKSPTGSVQQQTVSNDKGVFALSGVPSGQYLVEAEMTGFKTTTLGPLTAQPGANVMTDLVLDVDEIATVVTIVGADQGMNRGGRRGIRSELGPALSGRATGGKEKALADRGGVAGPGGGAGGGVGASIGVGSGQGAAAPGQASAGRPRTAVTVVEVGPNAGAPARQGGVAGEAKADQSRLSKDAESNTESYAHFVDNPFVAVSHDPLSTFSVDVDTASYANLRRFLNTNQRPPIDAVRIEEMVNYFQYDYTPPSGRDPIAVHAEVAQAFWKPEHRLVRIGLKAREIPAASRPAVNLVFLVDVSGSMMPPEKLPLLREALGMLAGRLEEKDTIALVTYAGSSQLVLPPTSGADKATILAALGSLASGGSTNGGGGIKMAYEQALQSFDRKAINRVVLATDGDFNVGITNQGDLVRYVEGQAKKGIFLTVLGFGVGNYKDSMLETLADKGDGNYAYIDSLNEARRVLVEQMGGTLLPVAKDVKIQVEFNPAEVAAYRLLGYENRILAHQDFADDTKDAGEMGAGHAVTALYEIVPVGVPISLPGVEPLKYQTPGRTASTAANRELLTLKIRYKDPAGGASKRMEVPIVDHHNVFDQASDDFRFAASVASFGMVLRESPHRGATSFEGILEIARGSKGRDADGLRQEFILLVQKARELGVHRQQ